MPRFSSTEKQRIKARLWAEGERLFTAHGLKKVTIDELVAAVPIAKASFYTFYESKEALYFDLVLGLQQDIFAQLQALLAASAGQPGRKRVYEMFAAMYRLLPAHPILAQIDQGTVELLARKLPPECLAAFAAQNLDAARVLEQNGIVFICSAPAASLAFGALYQGWLSLQGGEPEAVAEAARLLLRGVIEQVVKN